jgi:hypothetical protein
MRDLFPNISPSMALHCMPMTKIESRLRDPMFLLDNGLADEVLICFRMPREMSKAMAFLCHSVASVEKQDIEFGRKG